MTHALLYRPRQRWRAATAFAAAAVVHLAAVALAGIQRDLPIAYSPPEIDITSDSEPSDDSTTSPEIVTPPPQSELSTTDDLFPEAQSTPVPVRKQIVKPTAPLHRENRGSPNLVSLSNAKVLAIAAPRPEYPYEARRQRITGSGTVTITIDPITGGVTHVVISQSTGSPYLDNAAIAGFRRWRFKPGSVSIVKAPITFTMMGASY